MKSVLCYGDSNTYGYAPNSGYRYFPNVRWTGRLAKNLGKGYNVIEEGCNGRTTVFDDPIEGWKNGRDYLKACLNSHKPLDMVILMLGTNDLKDLFHASAEDIANGAETLVKDIKEFTAEKQGYVPKIVLISPAEIGPNIRYSPFYGRFNEDAITRSKQFPYYYGKVAERQGCIFFDAAKHIVASEADSVHFMPSEHEKLANVLSELVLKELPLAPDEIIDYDECDAIAEDLEKKAMESINVKEILKEMDQENASGELSQVKIAELGEKIVEAAAVMPDMFDKIKACVDVIKAVDDTYAIVEGATDEDAWMLTGTMMDATELIINEITEKGDVIENKEEIKAFLKPEANMFAASDGINYIQMILDKFN